MTRRILAIVSCMALVLLLAGCGPPTKEDLLAKARDVKTLQAAAVAPD